MAASPRPIQSVSNAQLYDRWAKVYDTDGNILQAVDDALIPSLLTTLFSLLTQSYSFTVVELGCGTGRNTAKLLLPSFSHRISNIIGLDLSPGMLEVARRRCSQSPPGPEVAFHVFDALCPNPSFLRPLEARADIVISTLVLEHLPISTFFISIKRFLKLGGYVLITNMHAEMGRISQAGFVDETGQKVRGNSYVYDVEEVVEAGKREAFELVGSMQERAVSNEDIENGMIGNRGKKWIGVRVWFGCVMRLGSGT